MQGFKTFIKGLIPNSVMRRYYAMNYDRNVRKNRSDVKDLKETFDKIYHTNHWGSGESISGIGSQLDQTEKIRASLRSAIDSYNIKSLLDIPCGDFNWMQYMNLSMLDYTGADIVAILIEGLEKQYAGTPRLHFRQLDLTADALPKVDLVFCRDCLVHLSYDNINKAIRNIKSSGSKYLMTTSFGDTPKNYDIVTGDWRPINLRKAPFSFPKPLASFEEDHFAEQSDFPDKAMLLFDVASLP